jgi:hypothetical protein
VSCVTAAQARTPRLRFATSSARRPPTTRSWSTARVRRSR